MAPKSKLRLTTAADEGIDIRQVWQAKKEKAALKLKRRNDEASPTCPKQERLLRAEGTSDLLDARTFYIQLNLDAVDDSDTSDSSVNVQRNLAPISAAPKDLFETWNEQAQENVEGKEENDNDEEAIPVSDLDDLEEGDQEDLIRHTRLTINNATALIVALDRISIWTDESTPFVFHQSVVAPGATSDSIPDVSNDLQRELGFYAQSLEAARKGRFKLLTEGVPFSRPKDYFAEMVKEDAHMEKVKAKLVDEASAKRAAAKARKLRDLKKFGKQLQVAKLQERQKAKRETLDKIKTLKRKRQESGAKPGTMEADIFDVAVDQEVKGKSFRRTGNDARVDNAHRPNSKRVKKNEKYGFGGRKRYCKSGDAVSSGDLSGFDAKSMKSSGVEGRGRGGGKVTARPGKARRKSMATR